MDLPSIANPKLLVAGLVAMAIGWLLRRWADRNSLTKLAADAVKVATWQAIKERQALAMPADVWQRIAELQQASNVVRAKQVAGHAARHMLASAVGVAGLVTLLIGIGLAWAGVYWK